MGNLPPGLGKVPRGFSFLFCPVFFSTGFYRLFFIFFVFVFVFFFFVSSFFFPFFKYILTFFNTR